MDEIRPFVENPPLIGALATAIVALAGALVWMSKRLIKVIENNTTVMADVKNAVNVNTQITKESIEKISELHLQNEIEKAVKKAK